MLPQLDLVCSPAESQGQGHRKIAAAFRRVGPDPVGRTPQRPLRAPRPT